MLAVFILKQLKAKSKFDLAFNNYYFVPILILENSLCNSIRNGTLIKIITKTIKIWCQ